MQRRLSYGITIFLATMVMLSGCEATTRYQVLSFFFDGVPVPGQQSSRETPAGGPSADGKGPGKAPQQRPSVHGPFGAKMCTACHEPNTNALLLPKDKLCFQCHILKTGRRLHGPVASGGCLVCHDPHRSPNLFLLVSPAREFCTFCHDAKEVFQREAHQGIDAPCTECHNPHGSDNDFFLR